jgi:hypothetical protein
MMQFEGVLIALHGGGVEAARDKLCVWGVPVLDIRVEDDDAERLAEIRAHVGDMAEEELRRAWLGVVLDNCCGDDVVAVVCQNADEIEHVRTLGETVEFDAGVGDDDASVYARVDQFVQRLGYRRREPDVLEHVEDAQFWLMRVARKVAYFGAETIHDLAQLQACLRAAKADAQRCRLRDLEALKVADPEAADVYDAWIEEERALLEVARAKNLEVSCGVA